MKPILYTLLIATIGIAPQRGLAQKTDENGGIEDGTTQAQGFARDQLFGAWDWVAKTRQPNRGGTEAYTQRPLRTEKVRINFDLSGRVTIQRNGKSVNQTTYSLVEDDARIIFGNWDQPDEFHLDEGPFDFENNLLWIRGEYNDKGATWQLVQAGTQPYAATNITVAADEPAPSETPTTATGARPVTRTATRKVVRRKRR
jgi:hypothetical protein